ncbi:MAG: helix-turn-helix transcriptional regulator [Alphaproteobacteria bacterium]|nr:helix-turn-helix transcriptional regulator [Alphaproteobacteria bacterium]NCQ87925.1 helix-turn-helix transcriptional regulator [Alphaproteobacteria bacterium]NCT05568.1 helix-turn-helix transcriptional regulator [Alphaproteobacteria bacterium]
MSNTMRTKGKANPIDEHVGKRLRQKRDLVGLSQERLAESVGVTFQQIQKYENGLNRISASRLYEFAQILKVPVSFFFDTIEKAKNENALQGMSDNAQAPFEGPNTEPEALDSKEAKELMRYYFSLNDPELRKNLLKFVKSMADNLKDQENPQ